MTLRSKVTAAFAALTLIGGASVAGTLAATQAGATTLTCTGVANQVTPPLGCGGDRLAYTARGTLDLAVLGGNYFNSPVGFATENLNATSEDWTVFALNGSVTDGPGFLGEYVAVYTPDGKFYSFTQGGVFHTMAVPAPGPFTVGTNVYCLSVQNLPNGPHGATRWHTVLRNCNSNGTFSYGQTLDEVPSLGASGATYTNGNDNVINVCFTAGSGVNVTGSGVSGNGPCWAVAPHTTFTVTYATAPSSWTWQTDNSVSWSHANKFQVWAPAIGPDGLILINDSLSHFHGSGDDATNNPYVLDDTAWGGSGTQALAYPLKGSDQLNQESSILGCTEPVTGLDTGYQLCPLSESDWTVTLGGQLRE